MSTARPTKNFVHNGTSKQGLVGSEFSGRFSGNYFFRDVPGEKLKTSICFQPFRTWVRGNAYFAKRQTIFEGQCSTVPHFGHFEAEIRITSKSKVAGMGGT